jgi:hypothetical protein
MVVAFGLSFGGFFEGFVDGGGGAWADGGFT